MFYYEDTKKLSKPKESQRRVVTEVREVTYYNNHPDEKVVEPVVTKGYETVTEMVVSQDFTCIPKVVGTKTVDARWVVKRVKKDKKKMFLNEPEELAE